MQLLANVKGAAHGIKMMGKKGWRFLGCFTLKQYAPRLEDVGYDGHVINMLRDANENINWREVDGFEPDAPAITPSVEMPSPPGEQQPWDYHQWVLSTAGWQAYYDDDGRLVNPEVCIIFIS